MTSDDAAPAPNDLDKLLGASVEAAVQLLSADGEFYPFALALTAEGEVIGPAVDPGTEHPSSEQVVDLLLGVLREAKENLRATSLCSDVRIRSKEGEDRDAIRIELEAPQGDPLVVLVPYADRVLDQPIGMPGERRVFL